LITAVNVRTLIAINFDGNEILIDDLGNVSIFVGFAVHHVAPVAPHRANVQEHRLVLLLGFFESFTAPLMPVNWLVHRRPQVRRRSLGKGVESVRTHMISVS